MKIHATPAKAGATLAALALVASLGACSSGDDAKESTASTSGSQTLEVWTRSGDPAKITYDRVFEAFTAKTGIKVDHQAVGEFDTQLAARAAEKNLPDILINDASSLGNYQAQGLLLPIDRDSIEGQENISDESWEQNIGRDGETYGVPWSRQANITMIRKDWREKLGFDVPKTWEDLEKLANAFATQDPDGNGVADTYGMVVPGTAKNGYILRWGVSYLWQAGGELLKDTGDGTYKSAINTPEAEKAMEFIRTQFCTPGNVVPGSINLATADTPFFQQGTAGIYLTGPYNIKTFDDGVGAENVEVIVMPEGPDNSNTFAEGENIYFGASSKKSAEQKALAEFMITEEAQIIGMNAEPPAGPPSDVVVRIPVNTNVNVSEVRGDPRWKIVEEAYAENAKTFPWNIDFLPFRQIAADGMNAIMADCNSDIKANLKKIDEGFNAELQAQDLLK